MEAPMDHTLALKHVQEALSGQVEATNFQWHTIPGTGPIQQIPVLRVLINDGPQWIEVELIVKSAQDVTQEDDVAGR
jgi:hypothetical protein